MLKPLISVGMYEASGYQVVVDSISLRSWRFRWSLVALGNAGKMSRAKPREEWGRGRKKPWGDECNK